MKLLVFAHTPPPHHGQSYMVQLMLEGFGGDHANSGRHEPSSKTTNIHGIECYHVNARLSRDLQDIGGMRPGKLFHLLCHCLKAIRLRFRHGIDNFYYIPAPGKTSALVRDWIALSLCRPFFKRTIFHWHAAGLAEWLRAQPAFPTRMLTRLVLRNASLSIVLSNFNIADAKEFSARRIQIVPNGIPDPCPEFETRVFPARLARHAERQRRTDSTNESDFCLFKLLFLAHCTREKGLFDTIEAVAIANQRLAAQASNIRIQLTAAGEFASSSERAEFAARVSQPDLQIKHPEQSEPIPAVVYAGFVSGESKRRLFTESDCFCFPTYHLAENFSVVLLEAMAFGLPVITSNWRSIPEMLPSGCSRIVSPRSPEQIAEAIVAILADKPIRISRDHFQDHFTPERHLTRTAKGLHQIE